MTRRIRIITIGALVISCNLSGKDLYSLSLEELLNIQVASKSEESNIDAAGVIAVVTQADIRQYGARNLRDILDRLANIQVIGSNLYPHNRVSLRGVTQTHTDNKILLLLNGRVIRDGNQGGINTDIYNLFPVEAIRKIEVIRGPGSVIYGTNAFSGVINIITSTNEPTSSQISVTTGSFGTSKVAATSAYYDPDMQFSTTASYQETDGENFNNILGEFGTSGTYPTDKQGYHLVATGKYRHASFNFLSSSTKQGQVKSLFVFPPSVLAIDRVHLDVGYQFTLPQQWSLETHYTYNQHDVEFDISNSRATETESEDIIFDAVAKGQVSNNLNLMAGVNYELIKGTIGVHTNNPTPFDNYQISAFSQLNWKVNDSNRMILGAQINKPQSQESDISPRFAFIHRMNSDWTFKTLYGEAFRSPFGSDLFLDSPSLQGNPNLKPEIIKTLDLQIIKQTSSNYFALTYYHSKHTDLHKRDIINGVPTFINHGQIDYDGMEFEMRQALTSEIDFNLNASHQVNEDENGLKQVTYNPQTMIKMGVSYSGEQGISFGLFDSYFSQPTDPLDIGIVPTAFNEKPKAYQLVTANIAFDLNQLFNLSPKYPMSLSFYVDNFLDESIYFPSINRTNVSSLPHHIGRNINMNFKLDF